MPLRKERVLNPFKRHNRFLKGYISIDLDMSHNDSESLTAPRRGSVSP